MIWINGKRIDPTHKSQSCDNPNCPACNCRFGGNRRSTTQLEIWTNEVLPAMRGEIQNAHPEVWHNGED